MPESTELRRRTLFRLFAGLPLIFTACSTSSGHRQRGLLGVLTSGNRSQGSSQSGGGGSLRPTGKVQHGKASWYSTRTNHGSRTASGEPLSNSAPTAAHRSLPFGTLVRVTNLRNDRSQIVKITDRGPFIRGRIIDVTIGVGERLDMVRSGVVPVKVEVMEPTGGRRTSA